MVENLSLTHICQNFGITHRFSCPHTHQQNELVERKFRHIVETGRALLAYFSLPFIYWVDALETAVYLINLLPSPVTQNKSLHSSFSSRSRLSFFKGLWM